MEQGSLLSVGQDHLSAAGEPSERDVVRRIAAHEPGLRRSPTRPIAEVGVSVSDDLPRGDHDLNPDFYPTRDLTAAAVLVPIVRRERLQLLLTRRTDHLHDHAGQIAFPGGRVDPGDADAQAAALRETEEEVGLPPRHIEIVGRLDTYVTRTGFEVTPVVGLVTPPFPVEPDSFEVAEVFEVPLSFVLDPGNRQVDSRVYQGRERHFYAFPYGDYYIWGATAGMLVNLSEILAPE